MAGDRLQRALTWANQRLEESPQTDLAALASDASLKFELKPADEEFIFRRLAESKKTRS